MLVVRPVVGTISGISSIAVGIWIVHMGRKIIIDMCCGMGGRPVTTGFTPHPVSVVPELDLLRIQRLGIIEVRSLGMALPGGEVVQAGVDLLKRSFQGQDGISHALSKHCQSIAIRRLLAIVWVNVER
jgi:hypothetical protein